MLRNFGTAAREQCDFQSRVRRQRHRQTVANRKRFRELTVVADLDRRRRQGAVDIKY